MKGPHERLKYELRRVFECSRCRRRVRVPGSVTGEWCGCTAESEGGPTCMALVEDGVRRIDGIVLTRRRSSQQPPPRDGMVEDRSSGPPLSEEDAAETP